MNIDKLKYRLRKEMPTVVDSYIDEMAEKLMNTVPEIKQAVEMWAETGSFPDVLIEGSDEYGGGFSIRKLMCLPRIKGNFTQAVLYLDEYAKDRKKGYMKILIAILR